MTKMERLGGDARPRILLLGLFRELTKTLYANRPGMNCPVFRNNSVHVTKSVAVMCY